MIDTHAHINFNAFAEDGDEVMKKALKNNVWLINVGSQHSTSWRAVEYAQKYQDGVYAAVGLHPIHLKGKKIKEEIDSLEEIEFETKPEVFEYDKYKELAKWPKVVAIGEVGLDYYHLDKENIEEQKENQKKNFIQHLELAKELDKPVIIHCREAHEDVLEILKFQVGTSSSQAKTSFKFQGVVHSFSGRWNQAEEYFKLGFYISFNGLITFARDYDEVIKNAPLERLLIETDCPYLTPVPYRGKRNEPSYVKYVAEKIAEIKGISFEEVAETTTKNARKLFKI